MDTPFASSAITLHSPPARCRLRGRSTSSLVAAEPLPTVLTRGHRPTGSGWTALPASLEECDGPAELTAGQTARGAAECPGWDLLCAVMGETDNKTRQDRGFPKQNPAAGGVRSVLPKVPGISKGTSGNTQKTSVQRAAGAEGSCKGQERIQLFSCQTRGGSAWEQTPGSLQIQTSGERREEVSWSPTSPFSCVPDAEFS